MQSSPDLVTSMIRSGHTGGGGRQASNDAENVEPQPRVRASTVGYKDGKVLLMNKANNVVQKKIKRD